MNGPLAVLGQAIVPVAAIIGIGWVWRERSPGGIDAATARRCINALVMYVFYPALALLTVVQAQLNAELVWAPLLTVVAILLGAGLAALVFGRGPLRAGLSRPQLGALVIACALPNIVSLGIPVIQATFGAQAQRYPIYADMLGIAPLFWTLGFLVAASFGTVHAQGLNWMASLGTLARLPPIWAFAVGLVMNLAGFALPAPLLKAATMLGYATMPCMLLTVGLSLTFAGLARARGLIALVVVIRLLVVPAVIWVIARTALGDSELTRAMTLLMGMPTMMATMMLAERFGLDVELLGSVMVGTTAAYFVLLPLSLLLL